MKRHAAGLVMFSAAVLFTFGVLLVFDSLSRVTNELIDFLRDAGPPFSWLLDLG
jgi:hypothetical protein